MRVQAVAPTPLQALNLVLGSIDAVRNARALWLMLATLAISGLLVGQLRQALVQDAGLRAGLAALAAFVVVFYGSNAVGLLLMDDARGRPVRDPARAVVDALARGHRLLAVVLCVLLLYALLLGLVSALLWATRWPAGGRWVMAATVPLAVGGFGLATLVMVGLVGPLAAPAVWSGLSVREVLALLRREARQRLPQVLLLSAAVSLLSAAVAGLVSFVVLAGARVLLALAAVVAGIDLVPQAFLAALFGQVLRGPPGAPSPLAGHPLAAAAVTGAGMVFVLGLVLPAVIYLRGLCAVFLAVQPLDETAPDLPQDLPDAPATPPRQDG